MIRLLLRGPLLVIMIMIHIPRTKRRLSDKILIGALHVMKDNTKAFQIVMNDVEVREDA